MSLADMQQTSYLGMNNISVGSSLSDAVAAAANCATSGSPFDVSADNVLTIEELRAHMGSCFTCGVSWTDDHVSLDCSECGGYSSQRPCPLCDGQCGAMWKRDFTMSHACSKARWTGQCPNRSSPADSPLFTVLPPSVAAAAVAWQQHHRTGSNGSSGCRAAASLVPSLCSSSSASSLVSGSLQQTGASQQPQQHTCGASQFLAQDLCVRLERLSASAQT